MPKMPPSTSAQSQGRSLATPPKLAATAPFAGLRLLHALSAQQCIGRGHGPRSQQTHSTPGSVMGPSDRSAAIGSQSALVHQRAAVGATESTSMAAGKISAPKVSDQLSMQLINPPAQSRPLDQSELQSNAQLSTGSQIVQQSEMTQVSRLEGGASRASESSPGEQTSVKSSQQGVKPTKDGSASAVSLSAGSCKSVPAVQRASVNLQRKPTSRALAVSTKIATDNARPGPSSSKAQPVSIQSIAQLLRVKEREQMQQAESQPTTFKKRGTKRKHVSEAKVTLPRQSPPRPISVDVPAPAASTATKGATVSATADAGADRSQTTPEHPRSTAVGQEQTGLRSSQKEVNSSFNTGMVTDSPPQNGGQFRKRRKVAKPSKPPLHAAQQVPQVPVTQRNPTARQQSQQHQQLHCDKTQQLQSPPNAQPSAARTAQKRVGKRLWCLYCKSLQDHALDSCPVLKENIRQRQQRSAEKQEEQRQRQRAEQMAKTPCRFYAKGRCDKGDDCPFSHDFDLQKTRPICKFFLANKCQAPTGTCSFSHDLTRLPCRYFFTVGCNEPACRFSHVLDDEKKALLEDDLLKYFDQRDKRKAVTPVDTPSSPTENASAVSASCLPAATAGGEASISQQPLSASAEASRTHATTTSATSTARVSTLPKGYGLLVDSSEGSDSDASTASDGEEEEEEDDKCTTHPCASSGVTQYQAETSIVDGKLMPSPAGGEARVATDLSQRDINLKSTGTGVSAADSPFSLGFLSGYLADEHEQAQRQQALELKVAASINPQGRVLQPFRGKAVSPR